MGNELKQYGVSKGPWNERKVLWSGAPRYWRVITKEQWVNDHFDTTTSIEYTDNIYDIIKGDS